MKKALLIIVTILGVTALAYAQSKCFQNDGLKDRHRITMTIEGRKVTGNFAVIREYDAAKTEDFPFTGTRSLDDLTIHFPGGKFPDDLSSKARRITWTLDASGDPEILTVKLYGMKYDVGLYEMYSAVYESCPPSYDNLFKIAQDVPFAKDATEGRVTASFTRKDERKAFIVDVVRKRRFSVTAPGCGISYFGPDKAPYSEGTAIDSLTIDSPPRSGQYLFVISPASEPGTCKVTFAQSPGEVKR